MIGTNHKRVFEYDGAFKCLDCEARWGAFPGKPKMPEECAPKAELAQLRTENENLKLHFDNCHSDKIVTLQLENAELKARLKRAAGILREWNDELAFELADELEKP